MTPADEALVETRIQAAIARLKAEDARARARAERWRTLHLLFAAAGAGLGIAAAIDWAAEALGSGVCL